MKDFKKLIKESHLGNPLNEVDDSKTVSTKHLDAIIYEDGGVKLRINSSNKSPYGYTKRDLIKSPFGVEDEEFTFDYIKEEIDEVYTKFPDEEIKELLNKVDQYKNSLNEEDRATRVDKMLSGEYEDEDYKDSKRYDDVRAELDEEISDELKAKYDDAAMDEYGKPFAELDIAQKQELMRAIIKWTGKEFETDFTRRRKGDYSDDRDDGMTDYQRRRMDENMGEWPKELTSRYSDEYRFELEKVSPTYQDKPGRAKYRVIDIESGELKGTPVFGTPESLMAYADDLIKKQGGTQSTNLGESLEEDINDPVLMRTRAAQMKRDAIDKKDLENKSKRISADEAIDLRYELSILNKEREDILMRIEDLGFETDQTAEPEGGEKADDVGERMKIALKDLRDIDSKIIDIKDDLGIFDMNESVNEEKDYSKMHNVELNATYKKKFGVKDTKGLTRDELIKKLNDADLDEGTCGYTPDGEPRSKPAGPDLNEDDELNVNIDNANDNYAKSIDAESRSGAYESLQKSLREKLQERLK